MIKDKVYKELHKKYNKQASFAIWADSKKKNKVAGDGIEYQDALKAGEISKIRFDRVILLINPSNKQKNNPESDFSAFHHKGVTDRNMRYILKNVSNYQEYYGAYLTDFYPDIQDTISSKAIRGKKDSDPYFQRIMDQLELLSLVNIKIKILFTGVMGNAAHQQNVNDLLKYFREHISEYSNLEKTKIRFEGTWQFGIQGVDQAKLQERFSKDRLQPWVI
ncbi:hypothetical protein [Liquorilactobacillus capillatus]|uniref:Uncharacterized protein n=1 Tax=Liquorilactobacillus capillatus DSM 19910 TaxID=1423731 RepID=A0A0R1M3H7_9LACO|nr:hypothetical protein [Liquorilactobacillus capillatus]KRL02589.1 hypothetical protein FC81_GL000626 [Liquorilactobacillus capillatus DSM 19910]